MEIFAFGLFICSTSFCVWLDECQAWFLQVWFTFMVEGSVLFTGLFLSSRV